MSAITDQSVYMGSGEKALPENKKVVKNLVLVDPDTKRHQKMTEEMILRRSQMSGGRPPKPIFHIDPETGEHTRMTEEQMITLSAIVRDTPRPLYGISADNQT